MNEILSDSFSIIVKHNTAEHEVLRDLRLLEAVGGKINDERMELWLPQADLLWAEELLKNVVSQKLIAVGWECREKILVSRKV